MKTTKNARLPFEHAQDLASAYRELSAALAALVKIEETGPCRFDGNDPKIVPLLSPCAIWNDADAKAAAWQRVANAARRVQVATHGRADARRTDGFTRARKVA
jgi:hypothetical protein